MLKNFNTWQARRPDEFVCSSLYKLCRKFSVTNTLQLFFADALPMRRLGWTRLGAVEDIADLSIKNHDRGIVTLCRPTSGLSKSSGGEQHLGHQHLVLNFYSHNVLNAKPDFSLFYTAWFGSFSDRKSKEIGKGWSQRNSLSHLSWADQLVAFLFTVRIVHSPKRVFRPKITGLLWKLVFNLCGFSRFVPTDSHPFHAKMYGS